jgi:hypothetical protein
MEASIGENGRQRRKTGAEHIPVELYYKMYYIID